MNNTTVNNTLTDLNTPLLTWRVDISVGILLYIIALLTMLGNVLVLVAVFVNKKLHTNFNYYVVNLAVTDFSVGMTGMVFHTTEMILGYWPFGGFICAIWVFLDYGMTFVSLFTILLISVDRFWSVTWSEHYRRFHHSNSKRNSIIAIISSW